MLGFSIESPVFIGNPSKDSRNDLIAHYESVERFLDALKDDGISSVEIRILPRHADESAYRELIQRIWSMGFELTIHGHIAGEQTGSRFEDVYPSLAYVLDHFHRYQSGLTMAIHAFDAAAGSERELHADTVRVLKAWSAMADAESLPIRFAVENNRKKKSKVDPGDSLDGVLRIVDEIGSERVGITWDMGHFYSNLLDERGLKEPPEAHLEPLPQAEFLKRVYHTHIHGIGPSGTHNSLAELKSLPLETYVAALQSVGYDGVYNLELTMNKFDRGSPLGDQVTASARRLKTATNSGFHVSY